MRPENFERLRRIGLALALLALTSCGGGGGGDSGPPASKLFVSDGGNHALISAINAAPTLANPLNIDRVVLGSSTGLGTAGGTPSISSIPSIALDAAGDRLFAATQSTVVTFDGAGTINGNTPFSRSFSATVITDGTTLRGVNFYGLSLDATNNRLYTVDPLGEVHVFNNASTRSGPTTPDRTITPNTANPVIGTFGIAIDRTRDMLYVGGVPNAASQFIYVFNGASTANTNTMPNNSRAPDRTITLAGAGSFYLDEASDRLYVARFDGVIWIFDNASGLTGTPVQNRTIDIGNGVQNFIFVDTSRNKLHGVANNPAANNQSVLNIVDNASTADEPNITGISIFITANNIRLSAVAVKP
jgi:hypothetical protein